MRREEIKGVGVENEGEEVLTRGQQWKVEKYHPDAAKRHWRVMRTVLPDGVWENW
jgi:hypothetical protein